MSGRYYLTWSILPYGARPNARPGKDGLWFGRRAQDKRRIGSGRRTGETRDVTVATHVSALLEFALGLIRRGLTLSFDSPTAFREFEVYGTKRSSACPIRGQFDESILLYEKDINKSAPDEWLKIPPGEPIGLRFRPSAAPKAAEWAPWIWPGPCAPAEDRERPPIWRFTCWTRWSRLTAPRPREPPRACQRPALRPTFCPRGLGPAAEVGLGFMQRLLCQGPADGRRLAQPPLHQKHGRESIIGRQGYKRS